MNTNSYDEAVKTTWISSGNTEQDFLRCVLALGEEAGEVQGKVKKHLRGDDDFNLNEVLLDELGDIQYYVSMLSMMLGANTSVVMSRNNIKLQDRKARGKIKGSGDTR